ncbi:MAG: hypothetical protein KGI45_03415 [Patescibacteria group bacterium]|nr:hypothetical protein [Patescibacteria group bacterium]
MQDIPQQFKEFADSTELGNISEKIGAKFGLNINQMGELDAEIRDVLTGVTPSKNFTRDIGERLEIADGLARQITEETNDQVFGVLKTRMKESVTRPNIQTADIAAIEHAGEFTIEKEEPKETSLGNGVTSADRARLLQNVEDPKPGKEEIEPKLPILMPEPETAPAAATERTPAVPKNIPAEQKKPPLAPQQQPKKSGPDPYREPIA